MLRAVAVASVAFFGLVLAPAAHATIIRFTADLSGSSENPPVPSLGSGTAYVTYDDLAHTLLVEAGWSGLTGTTTVSHIHCCAASATVNAGVAVTPGTLPGFPVGLTSGSYTSPLLDLTATGTYTAGFLTLAGGLGNAESVLIQNMLAGRAYFNIHTSFAPGGELRGTLRQVPEPGMLTLLATGLLGFAGLRRRRGRN